MVVVLSALIIGFSIWKDLVIFSLTSNNGPADSERTMRLADIEELIDVEGLMDTEESADVEKPLDAKGPADPEGPVDAEGLVDVEKPIVIYYKYQY